MKRIIDRFDAYMDASGLNDNKVTVQLGLTRGLIGKSRQPKRDLSTSVVEKILEYYKDLSRVWLLTGEGEMLINDQPEVPAEDQPTAGGSLIEYLERKIKELEKENADLLQENAVLKYENRMLASDKGGNVTGAAGSLSVDAV